MTGLLPIEKVQRRVLSLPFNRWLGLEVVSLTEKAIEIRMPWRDEIVGSPITGALHGGILGCLIDACAAFAIIARTGDSLATIDMRVDFHHRAGAGALVAYGEIVKLGRTMATADCRIFDAGHTLIASGRAVYRRVPRRPG